ncbi:unnamed protein product [Paramecium octaurelia]|uniref:Uncharacterized protein n=1 Tax=Paramecium octaurelia TaxID=43137 RepID=A0A8S1WSY9_PAROT|nr:unnamed protein product [Paramecium octaurelia]
MNQNKEIDELLFKKKELKQDLKKPHYPPIDITITSYSEVSDGTPNKFPIKKVYTEQNCFHHQKKRILTQEEQINQQNQMQASNSIIESMTPQRMNKLIDWSKYNVTPGDGKNIFPQVSGPTIFSQINTLKLRRDQNCFRQSIKIFRLLKPQEDRTSKQPHNKLFASRMLAKAQDKFIDELNLEIKKMKENELNIKDQILSEFKNKVGKDQIIENQEQKMQNLTNRLKMEVEYKKHDEKMLLEIKQKEIKRSSIFELNSKCQSCQQCKQELQNILQECQIEDDQNIIEGELQVPTQIRVVVTLLLTKQREQIDIAFQQYEDQLKELYDQIEYFKEQNNNLIEENNKLQHQLSSILNQRGEQENKLYEEFEKLININLILMQENQDLKLQVQSQNPRTFKSLRWREFRSRTCFQKYLNKKRKYNHQKMIRFEIFPLLNRIKICRIKLYKMKRNNHYKKKNERKRRKKFRTCFLNNVNVLQSHKKFRIQNINLQQQVQKECEQTIFELSLNWINKKQINHKINQIKQLIDQNKVQQDKNTELSQNVNLIFKMNQNNRQMIRELNMRVVNQYIQSNLSQQYLSQLVDEYKSYQQEFIDLKQVFTEMLRQHEILQNRLSKLQQDNNQLALENQKLIESQNNKDDKLTKRISEEITKGVRCSTAPGDSLNIKSFVQQGEEENLKKNSSTFQI